MLGVSQKTVDRDVESLDSKHNFSSLRNMDGTKVFESNVSSATAPPAINTKSPAEGSRSKDNLKLVRRNGKIARIPKTTRHD